LVVLYSSVGFDSGSSYLAILALSGIVFAQIRATLLFCNIAVVFGNVLLFYQQKRFHWRKILPLVLFSIPFALLDGKFKIRSFG
jgi:uncharacterized membrane protein YfcA